MSSSPTLSTLCMELINMDCIDSRFCRSADIVISFPRSSFGGSAAGYLAEETDIRPPTFINNYTVGVRAVILLFSDPRLAAKCSILIDRGWRFVDLHVFQTISYCGSCCGMMIDSPTSYRRIATPVLLW
jgi:hypothetical protein